MDVSDVLEFILDSSLLLPADLASGVSRNFRRASRRVLWDTLRSHVGANVKPMRGHPVAKALERVMELAPKTLSLLRGWGGAARAPGFEVAIDAFEPRSCVAALVPCPSLAHHSALPVWLVFDVELANERCFFPDNAAARRRGIIPYVPNGVVHLQAYQPPWHVEENCGLVKLTYCGLTASWNADPSWNPNLSLFKNLPPWKQRVASEGTLQQTLDRIQLDLLSHEDCPHSVTFYQLHKLDPSAYVNYQRESLRLFEEFRLGDPVPHRALAALVDQIRLYVDARAPPWGAGGVP